MKVLLVNGSPHIAGCTHRALQEVASALEAEGVAAEILHVGNQPIRGCQGCGMCRKSKMGKCIFGDDIVNVIIKKMEECDGLVIGSPVHFAAASGAITSLLDRLFYATNGFPFKVGAAVVSCRRAGSTAALEQLNKYFMYNSMIMVGSKYWTMVHGNTPEEVEQDLEGLMVMRTLGRNMAWMLKSIQAGKDAGLTPPAFEAKVRTNFIRKQDIPQAVEVDKKETEYKDFAKYFTSYNKVDKRYQEEE